VVTAKARFHREALRPSEKLKLHAAKAGGIFEVILVAEVGRS